MSHGIPNYVREILGALAALDHENEYLFYAHRDFDWQAPPGFRWRKRAAQGLFGAIWLQTAVPLWLRQDRVDLFWGTQHILPVGAPRRMRAFLTVYDLVFRRFPETMAYRNLLIHRLLAGSSFRRANLLGPISESPARDLNEYYQIPPPRVRVVTPAAGPRFRPQDKAEARRTLRPLLGDDAANPALLTVGTLEPRKNLETTLKAFGRLVDRRPHALWVVGSTGWKMGGRLGSLLTPSLRSRVKFLGHVSDDLLPSLYAAADVFVFPSLFEGFGMPVVESMACGTPVVTSTAPSLREVSGGAALLVEPTEYAALAQALERVLDDNALRDRMIRDGLASARRYDWRRSAEVLRKAFGELS